LVTDDTESVSADDIIAEEQQSIVQAAHQARVEYESVRGVYEAFARKLADVIQDCLKAKNVTVHSVTHRAKDPTSFERKAAQPSPDNPALAKYPNPLDKIADKAGVRIITYFRSTLTAVSKILGEQFEVTERETKISSEPDRLGYQSDHYLVKYSDERTALPEYSRFSGLVAEIQVRTILQHAWAEIEHDVQYKAVTTLPSEVRRRFAALAGLIEIADREFQAIEDADRRLREQARRNVNLGQLDKVEITPDSVKAYLDRNYGADGRMSEFSYQWTARLLLGLGFENLAEVDECVRGRDDDQLSRVVYGGRQGQLTRFETVLLAGMGENFILAHLWADTTSTGTWFIPLEMMRLQKLRDADVSIGDYRPKAYPEVVLRISDLLEITAEYEKRAKEEMRGKPDSGPSSAS
jgi:ppGpp synthetase/RelA/SpoT-type nucleotidyltranferase